MGDNRDHSSETEACYQGKGWTGITIWNVCVIAEIRWARGVLCKCSTEGPPEEEDPA